MDQVINLLNETIVWCKRFNLFELDDFAVPIIVLDIPRILFPLQQKLNYEILEASYNFIRQTTRLKLTGIFESNSSI